MKNIMTSIKKYVARITAGIIAAAALAATPLAADVPVHAQEVQYVVYDYGRLEGKAIFAVKPL